MFICKIPYQVSENKAEYSDVGFMNDSTEGQDGAKEVILDYVVSWTLRHAQNICSSEKPTLYRYCRRFLGLLLNVEIKDEDDIVIQTWKQYQSIDLWVYAKVNNREYDILIEDKFYSPLHDNQLERYKVIFDSWLDINRPNSQRLYRVISCMDSADPKTSIYSEVRSPYLIFYWDQIISAMKCDAEGESESDIFNEFWINW